MAWQTPLSAYILDPHLYPRRSMHIFARAVCMSALISAILRVRDSKFDMRVAVYYTYTHFI